jgi:hypothetical protein
VSSGPRFGVGLLMVALIALTACKPETKSTSAEPPPAASGSAGSTPAAASGSPSASNLAASGPTLHYASNTHVDRAGAAKVGFNLFDMRPDKAAIDALGPGQRALVWLGNLDNTNCTPGFTYEKFTAAVDKLAGDRKVFGYYISDEPHPSVCPGAVEHIRQRADYIRAKDPAQKSFIVVLDAGKECKGNFGCEYAALRPDQTHVDLFGIDPFICSIAKGCDFGRIDQTIGLAEAKGIPRAAMVPVIQVFGQTCNTQQTHYYKLPSAGELNEALQHWDSALPHPQFDFAYTWASEGPACPALDKASDLQTIVRARNSRT